jgi:hypothetical protein
MAAPPDLLARVGQALYGERWQTQLARALGVADRTVRRWVAGEDAPRAGVWTDLLEILARHQAELANLTEPLRAAAEPARRRALRRKRHLRRGQPSAPCSRENEPISLL